MGIKEKPVKSETVRQPLATKTNQLLKRALRATWRQSPGTIKDKARQLKSLLNSYIYRLEELPERLKDVDDCKARLAQFNHHILSQQQRLRILESLLIRKELCSTHGDVKPKQPTEDHETALISIVFMAHTSGSTDPKNIQKSINSILQQTHERWDLLILAGGQDLKSDPALQDLLSDPRTRLLDDSPEGSLTARLTQAYHHVNGTLVAYLDSKHIWLPDHLASSSHLLSNNPDLELTRGLMVDGCLLGNNSDSLLKPWKENECLICQTIDDLNLIVHRSTLMHRIGHMGIPDHQVDLHPEADLMSRLSAAALSTCLNLPVLSAQPLTPENSGPSSAPQRRWHSSSRSGHQLRVLYVVWHYPQLSETYIEAEIRTMLRNGVHVEVWCESHAASPYPSVVRVHTGSPEEAIALCKPDLIHVHWMNFCMAKHKLLETLNIPLTLKVHSFDVTPQALRRVLNMPWINHVYAFPSQVQRLGEDHPKLVPIRAAFDPMRLGPKLQKDRRMVLRSGAALRSKDVEIMFDLADMLPEFNFVYAGVTCNGFEDYVDELKRIATEKKTRLQILFDVDHDRMSRMMEDAAIYLHTAHLPGQKYHTPLGMPISVAEAMATGSYVVIRDCPEFSCYVGDAGGYYNDVEQAASLISATNEWTDDEWNLRWAKSVDRATRYHSAEKVLKSVLDQWLQLAGK
jgi:glycosyltransferase involved in cell wall biosynthesis